MEKINIAELLKDCPQGMELDSTMYDNLYFDSLDADYNGIIICYTLIAGTKTSISFTKYGTFNNHMGAKCVIFPKGKTTWEGFIPPCKFKDGDIIADNHKNIAIYKGKMWYNCNLADFYCGYRNYDDRFLEKPKKDGHFGSIEELHLATEEEKQKLFQAIKDNGYRWNPETKTLEKLIKPIFKVGDIVRSKNCRDAGNFTIVKVGENKYSINLKNYCIEFKDQDNYELVSNKLVEPKFKDGDIVYTVSGSIAILRNKPNIYYSTHCGLFGDVLDVNVVVSPMRLATEEEKQKLFDAIKSKGYKWNAETKTLEKLHKFKAGDEIRGKYSGNIYTISHVTLTGYELTEGTSFDFDDECCFELTFNKFDITTLVPFESKVLVRNCDQYEWEGEIFTRYAKSFNSCNFITLGGQSWKQCIPYNDDTKHLLGKTDDCDEYYKTWE